LGILDFHNLILASRILGFNAAKEKLEIVASLCEAKTAKEPEKYRLEPHLVKENFYLNNLKAGN